MLGCGRKRRRRRKRWRRNRRRSKIRNRKRGGQDGVVDDNVRKRIYIMWTWFLASPVCIALPLLGTILTPYSHCFFTINKNLPYLSLSFTFTLTSYCLRFYLF